MKLDVLICTMGRDGIERVVAMNLPRVRNVSYIVSWQMPEADSPRTVPHELLRDDISVSIIGSRGLSKNRNNSIRQSSADICLIADDDLRYTPDGLTAVIETFEKNPDMDVATFRFSGADGKWYSDREFDLAKPEKGYYPTSFEIAFRRARIAGKVEFNEQMGLGAPQLHSGEEAVFIHQALCRGLNCRYFPVTITRHAGLTTGLRKLTAGVLMGQGACFSITHPVTGLLRLPLFAWRNYRCGRTKLFPAMHRLLRGYIYGKRNFNHDGTIKSR